MATEQHGITRNNTERWEKTKKIKMATKSTEKHGKNKMLEEELSYKVRACVFEVYRELGAGFLEKVYEKALLKELVLQGLRAEAQVPLKVYYKKEAVGEYFADVVVEGKLILELKAQKKFTRGK